MHIAFCIQLKFKSTKILVKDLDLQKTLSRSSIDKMFFPTPFLPHLAEGSLATCEYRSLVCAAHRFGTRLSLDIFEEASVSWPQGPAWQYPRWLLVTYQKYSYMLTGSLDKKWLSTQVHHVHATHSMQHVKQLTMNNRINSLETI